MKNLEITWVYAVFTIGWITHWFLQEPEYPNRLQELVQIIMERGHLLRCIDVRMKSFGISFQQRWFLQIGVLIQIPEAYPIVQSHKGEDEYDGEGPEVQLYEHICISGAIPRKTYMELTVNVIE